jgi:hypothetical protein
LQPVVFAKWFSTTRAKRRFSDSYRNSQSDTGVATGNNSN